MPASSQITKLLSLKTETCEVFHSNSRDSNNCHSSEHIISCLFKAIFLRGSRWVSEKHSRSGKTYMFCRAMDSKRSVMDGKEDTKKKKCRKMCWNLKSSNNVKRFSTIIGHACMHESSSNNQRKLPSLSLTFQGPLESLQAVEKELVTGSIHHTSFLLWHITKKNRNSSIAVLLSTRSKVCE